MPKKSDSNELINWYAKIGCPPQKIGDDFKNTGILPNARILALGPSGSGKSSFVMSYLSKVGSKKFYDIFVFCGSGLGEPIYKFLKEKIPEGHFYDEIDEFPDLNDIPDDGLEKLVIIDDFITLPKKKMEKLNKYLIAGRKKKLTIIMNAQNMTEVPTVCRRNINYFVIFKMNDDYLIKYVLRTYGFSAKKEQILNMYKYATEKPMNFLLIDTTAEPMKIFRHNFLQYLNPNDF